MARLANPDSKRASARALEADFGVQVSLPQVYRMTDLLDDNRIEQLNTLAGQAGRGIPGIGAIVIMFGFGHDPARAVPTGRGIGKLGEAAHFTDTLLIFEGRLKPVPFRL